MFVIHVGIWTPGWSTPAAAFHLDTKDGQQHGFVDEGMLSDG